MTTADNPKQSRTKSATTTLKDGADTATNVNGSTSAKSFRKRWKRWTKFVVTFLKAGAVLVTFVDDSIQQTANRHFQHALCVCVFLYFLVWLCRCTLHIGMTRRATPIRKRRKKREKNAKINEPTKKKQIIQNTTKERETRDERKKKKEIRERRTKKGTL